jgi:hypothetical protein
MAFRNTPGRRASRLSVSHASCRKCKWLTEPASSGRSPSRGGLALVALAAAVVVAAAGCSPNGATPAGSQSSPAATATPVASEPAQPTPSPTPAQAPTPAPAQTTAPPPAPAPAPPAASPAPATSCYPISDEGTCYEPGEYCRDDDHGITGVAGDGESIECEDNDGWRWEPLS